MLLQQVPFLYQLSAILEVHLADAASQDLKALDSVTGMAHMVGPGRVPIGTHSRMSHEADQLLVLSYAQREFQTESDARILGHRSQSLQQFHDRPVRRL